jgi:hypothetical protein
MPDPVEPVATPVMMTDAYVQLGEANLRCLCEHIELTPENSPITVTTFCGVQDYPGPVKWHFTATFLQSFDPGATDDTLAAALAAYELAGTPVSYRVRPYASRPISPTNPSFEGTCIPQPYTLFGGDAGSPSNVDIDWIMTGAPYRVTDETVTIMGVSPGTGDEAGGTAVTVQGSNLFGATDVTFDGTAATNLVVGTTTITCLTPAATAPGPVDVVVTTPTGTGTGVGMFTYTAAPPLLASVTPNSGSVAGAEPVTLAGTGFTGATAVTFGATPATNVVVTSDTAITCTTPPGSLPEGSGPAVAFDVTVATPSGPSTLPGGFTYMAPPAATADEVVGGPGDFGPSGAETPTVAQLTSNPVVANPLTPWATGSHVACTDGNAYWDGTAWVAGVAP